EVAPCDRLLRPPAVEHSPFLADELHRLAVDRDRRPVDPFLDEDTARLIEPRQTGRAGLVQSRGTRSARCSGIRDQGAPSTTPATAPAPALARTWRRPSRRRLLRSSPSGRISASWQPFDSDKARSSRLRASTGAGSSASFGPSAARSFPRS